MSNYTGDTYIINIDTMVKARQYVYPAPEGFSNLVTDSEYPYILEKKARSPNAIGTAVLYKNKSDPREGTLHLSEGEWLVVGEFTRVLTNSEFKRLYG